MSGSDDGRPDETGQRSHKGPALLSKLLGHDGRERQQEQRARLQAEIDESTE
ncbi:hypothetical protein [Halococcus qingdaonensis]|uniref:hypothetical protein n=1 Tax=Halococcus qingdaonensis TaxID=224402 RepID=UPI002116F872|nr:hypothetical protein [Halococcus qingdaonensis]